MRGIDREGVGWGGVVVVVVVEGWGYIVSTLAPGEWCRPTVPQAGR